MTHLHVMSKQCMKFDDCRAIKHTGDSDNMSAKKINKPS